jgi:hypothetical protein
LQLRLRLLRFVTLFTRRFTENNTSMPSDELEALRQGNLERAREYWAGVERPNLNDGFKNLRSTSEQLEHNRSRFATRLRLPQSSSGFYGHAESMSLLDLLPLFLSLSAAHAAHFNQANISDSYMTLAASFMMHATMEQYFVCGARGACALLQSFAWGWKAIPGSSWNEEGLVNRMFRDEDLQQEIEGWAEKRDGYFAVVRNRSTSCIYGFIEMLILSSSNRPTPTPRSTNT